MTVIVVTRMREAEYFRAFEEKTITAGFYHLTNTVSPILEGRDIFARVLSAAIHPNEAMFWDTVEDMLAPPAPYGIGSRVEAAVGP